MKTLLQRYFGKYIRHAAGALAGIVFTALFQYLGLELGEETRGLLVEGFNALGMFIFVVSYAFVEKLLKRFEWLEAPESK